MTSRGIPLFTDEGQVEESYQGSPPVLFVLLGTTGRQIGGEIGLYDDYQGDKDLLVADTELRSMGDVPAAAALPLSIPDIAELRTRPDPYGEWEHILKYAFTDYRYTSSGDGTRSSPQEGHVAAAAAYYRLYDHLLDKVIHLGPSISRPSRDPTRVTILTIGFAGGGTFGGGLSVLLAAQRRVRDAVKNEIAVDRILAITLPSLHDLAEKARTVRALALMGGLAAIELTPPPGVEVAGEERLRSPLFEAAYLFGAIPEQRGVEPNLGRQQKYVAQALRALLEQLRPSSIGAQVLRWRRSLGYPERGDIGGLPYQFSSAGVSELLFERGPATELLSKVVLHQMYRALGEGAVSLQGESPRPEGEEVDRYYRRSRYEMGAGARHDLRSRLVDPEIPGPMALIAQGDRWEGVANELERAISYQVGTEIPAEVKKGEEELDQFLTDQYRGQLEAAGVLSTAGYERALSAWEKAEVPRRPNVSLDRGKQVLARAEERLKRTASSTWDWGSAFWPVPGILFMLAFIVALVWIFVAIPLFIEASWAIWFDPSFLSSLGPKQAVQLTVIYDPALWFLIAAFGSWAFLSSPLFHLSRVDRARRELTSRKQQRINAYLDWAADDIGNKLDLHLRDEAQRRRQGMEAKALVLREARCAPAHLKGSEEEYQKSLLWIGASVDGGHRAALSPLRGSEWLTFQARKLTLGDGTPTERGKNAWHSFAIHVLSANRVAEVEQADAETLHTIISEWAAQKLIAPEIDKIPHLFDVLEAGEVNLGERSSELLLAATPPIILKPHTESRSVLEERTKPFVELPRGATTAQSSTVQRVFGLEAQPSEGENPDRLLVLRVTGPYISCRMVADNGDPLHEEILRRPETVLNSASCPQIQKAMEDTDILGRVLGTYKKNTP